MKILYIHAYPLDNKMANSVQVISMCKAFTYHGNSVYLLSPFPKTNTKVLRETLNTDHNLTQNIELIFFREWPKNQRISLFLNYFDVKKRIRKVNPDFCFVRNSSFLRACISALPNCPLPPITRTFILFICALTPNHKGCLL